MTVDTAPALRTGGLAGEIRDTKCVIMGLNKIIEENREHVDELNDRNYQRKLEEENCCL